MQKQNYQTIRKERTSKGKLFEQYVCREMLRRYGISIHVHDRKQDQYEIGESLEGYEIKFDDITATTGRLWIEIEEKASPRPGDYVRSGIFRRDNSKYYIIGDYDLFFVFWKEELIVFLEGTKPEIIENYTKTSRGFFLYRKDAHRLAIYTVSGDGDAAS